MQVAGFGSTQKTSNGRGPQKLQLTRKGLSLLLRAAMVIEIATTMMKMMTMMMLTVMLTVMMMRRVTQIR